MRTLVPPPPELRCDQCRGELRLKQLIVAADETRDVDTEIFVCVKCGREQSHIVSHDRYSPHLKAR